MPSYTVDHGIYGPLDGDPIKSGDVPAELARILRLQASSMDTALTVEGSRVEAAIRELIDPQPLAPGTDLNDVRETGRYFVRLTVEAQTITNRPEGIGDGPFILDVVTTPFNQTTQSYSGYSGAAAGFFTRQTGNAAGTAFTPWADGGGSGVGGSVNALRVLDFTTRRPVISTGNKGAVALRFDHGLTKFKASILPLLRTNNLKSSLALNSRTWTSAENSGATKADVISWVSADGVEVWNHGASHTDAASTIALTEQIVTGLAELRADLPGVTIDGFVIPGVGGTNYDGFNGGATIEAFSTTAGQLILENHAVSTGAFPGTSQRVLDGRVRQGQGHYSIEAQTVTAIKAQIDLAVTNKTGLQLMMHPSVLDTAGNLTTAQLGEVLAYIRNRVDAGVLVALSPYEMMVADSRVDATAEVESRLDAFGIVSTDSEEWPLAVTDSQGRVVAGVNSEGKFSVLYGDVPIKVLNPDVGLQQTDSTEWPWAIADADGYVIAGVNAAGQFVVNRAGGAGGDRSSRTQIAFIGDSLVAGYSAGSAWAEPDSIATKLQAVMPAGVTVTRNGYTGATTGQINLFMGALEVYVRIPGGVVPASGVFALTVDQAIGGYEIASAVLQVTGYLKAGGAEVFGTLRREADGTWNFNRLTAGGVIPASTGSFTGQNRAYKTKTVIYQPGRNDVAKNAVGPDTDTVAHVLSSYADMVESLTPHTKQIIVTGTITRTVDKIGDPLHQEVMDIRAGIKARYPNYFVDLQDYLVNEAMGDLGLTPTTDDIQAVADYTIPPSLMDDETHYSRATANAIAVNLYATFLKKKGWV